MVERVSKLTKLEKISRKTAEEVKDALVDRLSPVQKFVMTLTADNGKEFAYHEQVSQSLETNFYFATPYHSWERGLNEHTNGLVRQYLPKTKQLLACKSRGSLGVDLKSTIILNRFPFLFINI